MTEFEFDFEKEDFELLVKALKEYRPDTTEEEGIKCFYMEQFQRRAERLKRSEVANGAQA
jgi:hypothetical protein